MSVNLLRRAFQDVAVLNCLTLDFPTAALAEFAGRVGYRALAVDMEHGNTGWGELENLVRACDLSGTALVAKVPVDPTITERCLDVGVHGLHLTHVSDPRALAEVVNLLRPAPHGTRGVNRCRANYFGHYPGGYATLADEADPVFLMVTVEDLAGVQALPDILRIDEVDAVFVGTYDLSSSMGLLGKPNDPDVTDLVNDKVIRPTRQAGKIIGLSASTFDDHQRSVERGARLTLASQARLLSGSYVAQTKEKEPVS